MMAPSLLWPAPMTSALTVASEKCFIKRYIVPRLPNAGNPRERKSDSLPLTRGQHVYTVEWLQRRRRLLRAKQASNYTLKKRKPICVRGMLVDGPDGTSTKALGDVEAVQSTVPMAIHCMASQSIQPPCHHRVATVMYADVPCCEMLPSCSPPAGTALRNVQAGDRVRCRRDEKKAIGRGAD